MAKFTLCLGLLALLSLAAGPIRATEAEQQEAAPPKAAAPAEASKPAPEKDAKAAKAAKDEKAEAKTPVTPAVGTVEDIFRLARLDLSKLAARAEQPAEAEPQVVWQEVN